MTGRERHPEVVYLPAIFRDIRSGHIRVPAFQRGYVWEKSRGLQLLDSVKNKYPIGSLLFWESDISSMRTDDSEELALPHPPVEGVVDFVLDGMQRISTLYGAFHSRPGLPRSEDKFAVSYDLRTETFVTPRDETESCIDLRRLFAPRELLSDQARLGAFKDGDTLVERSIDLLRRFQEYLVPVIRISSEDAAHVVQIFERVNSTGIRLGAVDFMRALTWHTDFDLTKELTVVADRLARRGWHIPQATIAKCIAGHVGVVPKSDEMLKLRMVKSDQLKQSTRTVEQAIHRVTEYLEREFAIRSYDYVPYEAQFLVLVGIAHGVGDREIPEWVNGWFWKTGFSEWFFGKPDLNVAQIVQEVRTSPYEPQVIPLRLTAETIARRQLRKGGAVAMTMTAALAQGARSVVSGKAINREDFLARYDSSSICPVFDRGELPAPVGGAPQSDKLVANCVLLAPDDDPIDSANLRVSMTALAATEAGREALETQGVDEECLLALAKNDAAAFVRSRADALQRLAEAISSG